MLPESPYLDAHPLTEPSRQIAVNNKNNAALACMLVVEVSHRILNFLVGKFQSAKNIFQNI